MTPEQINHIVDAYAFTLNDKATLATSLAEAYLHAKQQAYQRAHTTAGNLVTFAPWKPGKEDRRKALEWSAPRARSIAETYETLLRSQLEQMQESGPQEGLGDIWQGIQDVVSKITDWFGGFLGWKTDQIAQDTWNEGDNDGTEQFVDDVRSGGDDYSRMRVRVLPDESSDDYCKEYAGQSYGFDEVGSSVPEFPTHSFCVHYLQVYIINADGEEEEIAI